MCWKPALACAMVAAASLVTVTRAAQMPAASIPGEARWVMHLNVDAARGTPLWELLRKKFVEPRREEMAPRVAAIENITGTQLPRDLHDVTIFGTAFDEMSVGLLIHAPINEERVTVILKLDPEFRSSDHHGRTILTWRDKERDRLMYASFLPGETVVLSPSAKTVALVLDTIEGRTAPTKNTNLLPKAERVAGDAALAGPILWIASTNVSDLPRTQAVESPFLVQVDAASVGIGTAQDQMWARAAVLAKTEKAAQQLAAAADGVKAMVALAASDERSPAKVRLLGNAVQALVVKVTGKDVTGEWSIGIDKIEAILEVVTPTAPATRGTNLAAPGTFPEGTK
jgi:hypothetical protein